MNDPSDFDVMRARIHRAAEVVGVDWWLAEQIAQPRRVIELNLVVVSDEGVPRLFQAWRVQHSSTRALNGMKGGLKISPTASRDSVVALAAGMTVKTTVAGLPLGGAKGGICADPALLSPGEKERLIRRYALEIAPDLGSPGNWVDVPAPDMNVTADDMAVFADTISRLYGGFTPGVVTGKPVAIGGIPGRVEATGFGVAHVADQTMPLNGLRVAVSGFGNVGSYAAATSVGRGATLVLIDDPGFGGVLVDPDGVNLDMLDARGRHRDGLFEQYVMSVPTASLFDSLADAAAAAAVDVYLPCAAPQAVNADAAEALCAAGAVMVVEGANSPLTPAAHDRFVAAGAKVVPDVIANSGGVICSFLEMSKAASMTMPSKRHTLSQVGGLLSEAYARVNDFAGRFDLDDLRLASDAFAVAEIAEVHRLRGVF